MRRAAPAIRRCWGWYFPVGRAHPRPRPTGSGCSPCQIDQSPSTPDCRIRIPAAPRLRRSERRTAAPPTRVSFWPARVKHLSNVRRRTGRFRPVTTKPRTCPIPCIYGHFPVPARTSRTGQIRLITRRSRVRTPLPLLKKRPAYAGRFSFAGGWRAPELPVEISCRDRRRSGGTRAGRTSGSAFHSALIALGAESTGRPPGRLRNTNGPGRSRAYGCGGGGST